MASGILSAMFVPGLAHLVLGHAVKNPLYLFPIIFGISVIGCLLGTFLGKPEEEDTLKRFYRTVNPWGAWDPFAKRSFRKIPRFSPTQFPRGTPRTSWSESCGNYV